MENEKNRESGDGLTKSQWIVKHVGGGELKVRQLLLQTCTPTNLKYVLSVLDENAGIGGGAMTLAAVTLSAVYLTARAIYSIYQWYNGTISGARCAKSIIDEAGAIAGGIAGGVAAGALGALMGPIGAVAFGAIGSLAGTFGASLLMDQLTNLIFDLPPTQALEESYKYLKIRHTATNEELNKAFRELCLKHHPDKGGNADEFLKLQSMFQVIKIARGQVTN